MTIGGLVVIAGLSVLLATVGGVAMNLFMAGEALNLPGQPSGLGIAEYAGTAFILWVPMSGIWLGLLFVLLHLCVFVWEKLTMQQNKYND